jgi:CRP-like cAMP-binding protein
VPRQALAAAAVRLTIALMVVDGTRATQEALGVLGRTELFRGLAPDHQTRIAPLLRPLERDTSALLVREGAPAARLVVVASGKAEVLRGDAAIAGAGPGSVVGEAALLAGTTHGATVRAVTPVRGYELEAADFALLRNQFDSVAFAVLLELGRVLAARVRAAIAAVAGPAAPAAGAGRGPAQRAHASRIALVRELPFFASFSADELSELVGDLHERELLRGATLFREGEPASGCAIVAEGALEVGVEREGRAIRLATLGPGRLVGELSLLDRGPRTATCTAYDDAVVLELSSEHFERLVHERSRPTLGLLEAMDVNLLATLQSTDRRLVGEAAAAATASRPRLGRSDALVRTIRSSIIGDDAVLDGPFGPRRVVYADYTASGRALSFVERFLRREVLPLYANTHTEASATGLQTTRLREDARRIIHRAVG